MLITGDKLLPKTRQQVLAAYLYRLTTENGYPKNNPCGATVPAISDEEWLRTHAFYVTRNGRLDRRYNRCEPAFLADEI